MSQFNDGPIKSFVANANLTAGTIVKIVSGKVVAAASATDKGIGFALTSVSTGEQCPVRLRNAQGTSKVIAGAAIAVGDLVTSDATGRAIATTTAGNVLYGQAIEAASAANEVIEVINMQDRF